MGRKKKQHCFLLLRQNVLILLISTNQNLFSCKQILSFKLRVHRESIENGGSKQRQCFLPSSQINDAIYTAPSEGNCGITAASPNSTLESSQHSMVNLDSCHDYSYENTAKEQEQLFDKELFLEEVRNYPCLWNASRPS